MPERREVTGRDAYIIVEALAFSVEALGKLPIGGGQHGVSASTPTSSAPAVRPAA
jgi:hypothetical protein